MLSGMPLLSTSAMATNTGPEVSGFGNVTVSTKLPVFCIPYLTTPAICAGVRAGMVPGMSAAEHLSVHHGTHRGCRDGGNQTVDGVTRVPFVNEDLREHLP